MNEQLVRKLIGLERRLDGLRLPEQSSDLISPFLALPGLVGFWPMSSVQRSTGNAYDLSGQGRTLTYNGNPTYDYSGLVPYIALDGVGDYLSRADETDLDILGTETVYAAGARGLTAGGWFWATNAAGATEYLMCKSDGINQRSYELRRQAAGGVPLAFITTDGSTLVSVTSTLAMPAGAWRFVVARFTPSTELAVFHNNVKTTNAVGIPASVFSGTGGFSIGSIAASSLLTGRASLCFLCANALPDAIISSLFQQTRGAFGI